MIFIRSWTRPTPACFAPIAFPIGDAKGCARVKVLGVEACPTVIADGLEIVVSPSVTLPCSDDEADPPLPPLENVASLASGPFSMVVPVAATYEELARAMTATFTNGKLFFSSEHPGLYLEKPQLYETQGCSCSCSRCTSGAPCTRSASTPTSTVTSSSRATSP